MNLSLSLSNHYCPSNKLKIRIEFYLHIWKYKLIRILKYQTIINSLRLEYLQQIKKI